MKKKTPLSPREPTNLFVLHQLLPQKEMELAAIYLMSVQVKDCNLTQQMVRFANLLCNYFVHPSGEEPIETVWRRKAHSILF